MIFDFSMFIGKAQSLLYFSKMERLWCSPLHEATATEDRLHTGGIWFLYPRGSDQDKRTYQVLMPVRAEAAALTDSFGLTEIISSFVIDFDTAFVPIVYVLYDVIRPSSYSTFDKF